jgi:hypothetical protein
MTTLRGLAQRRWRGRRELARHLRERASKEQAAGNVLARKAYVLHQPTV